MCYEQRLVAAGKLSFARYNAMRVYSTDHRPCASNVSCYLIHAAKHMTDSNVGRVPIC